MAGTSYTRQSTITDGNLITASLFNNEYNQLLNAFVYSSTGTTGHTHDGTAGQGGAVGKIGDQDFKNKIEISATDNRIECYIEVGGSPVEQLRIQDGAIVPVTDSDIDLGTTSLRFKDAFVDSLTVTGVVTATGFTIGSAVITEAELEILDGKTFLDEDDLVSDSATGIPSQQSVKAYVDAQVTAQDLDLTDGTTSISIDLDSEALSVLGGTGITSTASGNGVTLAIDSTVATLTGTQTLTNKTLTAPDINTPDIDGGTIDGTIIGGTTAAAGSFTTVDATGNITVGGTVDGRDVAADGTKLDGIEASADVTDTTNVTAAGALMDSEVTNLAQVKAFDSADYATAAQGTTADAALPKSGGAMTGAITTNSTFDGRDVATDGTKLDGIEVSADVTDTTNVTAAGALMDSELTSIASVKALNQGVATTDSPTFAGLTTSADVSFGDNDKALFGAGSDLQIYHDGNNSYINDAGTGALLIRGSNVSLAKYTGETMVNAFADGRVDLYYDNAIKLTTVTGGIDVTGNLTMASGGSIVAGGANDLILNAGESGTPDIYLQSGSSTKVKIEGSDGSVGIGTSSPRTLINASSSTGAILTLESSDTTLTTNGVIGGIDFYSNDSSTNGAGAKVNIRAIGQNSSGTATALTFGTSASGSATAVEALRIDASGNVILAAGTGTLQTATAGTSNFRAGVNAGNSIASGGNYNVVVGDEAGTAITTGDYNVAVGYPAGTALTTGGGNVGIGGLSLTAASTGNNNTAVGFQASRYMTTASNTTAIGYLAGGGLGGATVMTGNENTLVGASAGLKITTGANNTSVGKGSMSATTTGGANAALGVDALLSNTTGDANTAVGYGSLDSNTTANNNTAVGSYSLGANTTGDRNVAMGTSALDANTTADGNTAVGYASLSANTGSELNVAVGFHALRLYNNTSGSGYNTAVGALAGDQVTTGIQNTLIGGLAGDAITTASNNTAVGYASLTANTTGANNVAVGSLTLDAATTATGNTAVGQGAMSSTTTGASNVAMGLSSLYTNTTGANNTALGYSSMFANTTGTENVATGKGALQSNTTGSYNHAFGVNAGYALTTGSTNIAIGNAALSTATTAGANTAVGHSALAANTTASNNTAVGHNALTANTTGTANAAMGQTTLTTNTTGSYNSGFGRDSLGLNTTGSNNTAVGESALYANTTASNNTAVGKSALVANTTGAQMTAVGTLALTASTTAVGCTALGFRSLNDNTTGDWNIGVGYDALGVNTTGTNNTAVGTFALDTNTTGSSNTAVGYGSLDANTTGADNVAVGASALTAATNSNNTALGRYAGSDITSGYSNTCVGYDAGASADPVTTGIGNTQLGAFTRVSSGSESYANTIGYNVKGYGNYTTLGKSGDDIRTQHGSTSWSTVSDERYKKDIVDSEAGLSFINTLQPRIFNYRTKGELPEAFDAYEEGSTEVFKSSQTQHGFIAQEIKAAIDADDSIKDGFKLWDDREDGSQEVAEAALIPVLVKAIQELSTQLDAALARIETLEG